MYAIVKTLFGGYGNAGERPEHQIMDYTKKEVKISKNFYFYFLLPFLAILKAINPKNSSIY